MTSQIVAILLSVISLFLVSCTDYISDSPTTTKPADQQKQSVQINQSVDVREASQDDCVNGGVVYTIYLDMNINSTLDTDDVIVKKYPVCNGSSGKDGSDGKDGANGADGKNGTDGTNGKDGVGVAFKVVAADLATCPAGGSTILMASDPTNSGVYDVTSANQQAMTICNGQNEQEPSYTPVEPIMACGESVAYKEVLLRLSNGQVLGSFSNDVGGTMTRLAFLPDGTFMNTDISACVFSLSTSADGKTRSISWAGQVQKSWEIQY